MDEYGLYMVYVWFISYGLIWKFPEMGYPQIIYLIELSLVFHPFWGTTIYGTPHMFYIYVYTSSTAQGGGGSFKNRKPIGKVGC